MKFIYYLFHWVFFPFQTFEVVKIIVDPRYDAGHYKYDGCILKTSEPVTSTYGYVFKKLLLHGKMKMELSKFYCLAFLKKFVLNLKSCNELS